MASTIVKILADLLVVGNEAIVVVVPDGTLVWELTILTTSPNDVEPVPDTPSRRLMDKIDVRYELYPNLTGLNVNSRLIESAVDPDN